MTEKSIRFYDRASTFEEAKKKAKELLKQFPKEELTLYYNFEQEQGKRGYLLGKVAHTDRVTSTPTDVVRKYPTALVQAFREEAEGEAGNYSIYVSLYDRLPFYYRYSNEVAVLVRVLQPTPKPTELIDVEAINTPEGRKRLDAYLSHTEIAEEISEEAEALQAVEQELKIYALYDNFGELSLMELKEAIDSGEYDGGIGDGQSVLSEVTGETYKTEEEYLTALSNLCGVEAVEQHRKQVVHGYRFYKALHFLQYVEYRLRQTENYLTVEAELPELEQKYGIKAEDYTEIGISREALLSTALYRYLREYLNHRAHFNGVTDSRIADYLNAPLNVIRRLQDDTAIVADL